MKRNILIILYILLFANAGWCISISDTTAGSWDGSYVGTTDLLLHSGTKVSGEEAEEAWVNSYFESISSNVTATYYIKNETVPYYFTDETYVFAFYMAPPEAEYFLIKNSTHMALFQNNISLDWGVFDVSLNDFPDSDLNLGDDFTISHVSRYNASPVPEPSTLLLLGAGITGLAFFRRKK